MNKTVRMISRDSLFLAILVVCTFFTFDAGVTKITLQLLAVFLIANFLPLVDGLIIIALYIIMGLIGIPVFAGFGGGPAYALAPTFGFVYGFYLVILINHLFNDVLLRRIRVDMVRTTIASSISLIVLYIVGFMHGYLVLSLVKGNGDLTIASALGLFIIPYLPFDITKLVLSSLISSKYMNLLLPYRKRHFDEIESTNTYLLDNHKFYGNMTFIDASYQSKGKGRMGRVWESEKHDSLMFSVLIKDRTLLKDAPVLSLLAGTSVLKFLKDLNIKDVSIKWPNDIYVGGKKICGILLESVSVGSHIEALVIGIGLNVNQDAFPKGLRREPTSIKKERGHEFEIKTLRKDLYSIIKKDLKEFKSGSREYLDVLRENNYLKDRDCYYEYEGETKQIHIQDIAEDGSLIGIIDGKEKHVFSDEITFLNGMDSKSN